MRYHDDIGFSAAFVFGHEVREVSSASPSTFGGLPVTTISFADPESIVFTSENREVAFFSSMGLARTYADTMRGNEAAAEVLSSAGSQDFGTEGSAGGSSGSEEGGSSGSDINI